MTLSDLPLLIHPCDLQHAKIRSVPAQFVLDMLPAVQVILPRPRRLSVYELYEAIHGWGTACSITLPQAEEAVLRHLEVWHGTE